MALSQTAARRALRRTATASVLLVLLVSGGAALAAGLASWASRPEAWALGFALPLRAAAAWSGAAAPVLVPVAALMGAFLAARSLGRSGERAAWTTMGIGPWGQWAATAPLWVGLAVGGLLWTGWIEPAAWAETIALKEAVATATAHAVALPHGGVAQRDGDTMRLFTVEGRAALHAFDAETRSAGPVVVEGAAGTWTAREVTLQRRLVPRDRRPSVLTVDLPGLLRRAPEDRRAATLLHRRSSLPVLVLLFSVAGWGLGSVAGVRRRRVGAAGAALVLLPVLVLGVGRLVEGASAPPALLGWTPVLLAALATALLRAGRGRA